MKDAGMKVCMLCALLAMSLMSHAQIAKDKCKFIGNIIAGYTPADFKSHWNQVTPENAGKWGSVEATRDNMNWSALDMAYQFAKDNGLPFKQHTLVWGQQQPGWIADLSEEEQKEEVEEWISEFCQRYPDTDFIDVVNEPLHAPPSYMQAIGGSGATGWEWVVWAFEKAREYCPNAKLVLNDYNVVSSTAATDQYLRIIDRLKGEGLIDVIGEQGHFLETTELSTITSNLDKLGDTGLPIHISEFDINLADDAEQKARYEALFPLLWRHPDVHGITLWGYKQGEIWRTDAYLLRANGSERPAMEWLRQYVATAPGGTFCITSTEEQENEFGVYPNPTNGNFSVELDGGEYLLRITDLQGRERWSARVVRQRTVNVELNEPPGMYLLHVSDGSRKYHKKILFR